MFSHQTFALTYPSLASWSLFMLTFHPICLFFDFLDRTHLFQTYKIYKPTDNTPSYRQMLPRVLFNQLFLLLPCMVLTTHLQLSYAPKPDQPGPIQSTLGIILFTPALHEVAFYVIHRYVLHSSWGYHRLDHALHHTTKAHSAISAMYMSAPDFVLEIILPYLVPLVFVSHFNYVSNLFCLTIFPFGALGGLYEHSGYNFIPNIRAFDTTAHGLHHIYYHCSFADGVGSPSMLDAIFGTVCPHVGPIAPAFSTIVSRFVRDTKTTEKHTVALHHAASMPQLRTFQDRFANLWKPFH